MQYLTPITIYQGARCPNQNYEILIHIRTPFHLSRTTVFLSKHHGKDFIRSNSREGCRFPCFHTPFLFHAQGPVIFPHCWGLGMGLKCYLSRMISVIAMMQLHVANSTTDTTNMMHTGGFAMQTKDKKHFVFLYNSFVAACGADAGNSF